jgi:hypothetical protein
MKINCRECDICGEQMGGRDFQYWIRVPKVRGGYPALGMRRVDVCDECFAKLAVLIQHPELLEGVFDVCETDEEG